MSGVLAEYRIYSYTPNPDARTHIFLGPIHIGYERERRHVPYLGTAGYWNAVEKVEVLQEMEQEGVIYSVEPADDFNWMIALADRL